MGNYMLWVGIIMLSLNYFALDLADHDYPIANSLGFFLVGMYVSRYSLPFLTESVRRYAVPFLLATLALTWWLVGHRDPAQLHAYCAGNAGADVPGHPVHGVVSARGPDGWRGWPRRASSSSARTTSSSSCCVKAAGLRGRGRPGTSCGSAWFRSSSPCWRGSSSA